MDSNHGKNVRKFTHHDPHPTRFKNSVTAIRDPELSAGETRRLNSILEQLKPWRKGPFSLYGINIDTEWRSDWKWDRVYLTSPFKG